MKKTYINPVMEVVKVQTMQMLAASETMSVGGTTEQNLGRDFDFDDEE